MKTVRLIFAALLFMLAHAATAQPLATDSKACPQSAVASAANQVLLARKNLLSLPVGDGLQTDVSPAAMEAVTSMKNAVSEFVRSYMRCASAQFDTAAAEKDLMTLAGGYHMPSGEVISNDHLPPDFGRYGFELFFGVRQSENPRLVGITADFSIECGGDTVLLIFAPKDGSWSEALHWQTKPYSTVAGGTMAFDYGISPVDGAGGWYAVVHSIAPWCSSTWSSIRYEVLRPTADATKPSVLMSNSDFMWWGNDDYGKLTVGRSEFDLRFHSSSIDTGVHNRVWIRHYLIIGDTVKRIQPVAASPRDFVDEWIVSPWSDARQWSSLTSSSELRQAHDKWSRHEKAENRILQFCSVRKCLGDRYQVEVCEETGTDFNVSHSSYFEVAGNDPFTMTRVSMKPNRMCKGRDLLEDMATK